MSGAEERMMCCASCGITENDDTKLKTCNACKSVRYCSVECQRDHRPQHKKDCKIRVGELRDEILFKQPESSHLGDCPICCLPLSIDPQKSTLTACCSKVVCNGCENANWIREAKESLDHTCPFCRHPVAKTQEEAGLFNTKRVAANDPVAICQMGVICGDKGDYKGAFQHNTKAAELGDIRAHYLLSIMYRQGKGVEKDVKKELHHLEQAAIGGHPVARHNLGYVEEKNGRLDRAVKHYIIAATLGFDDSLDAIKEGFKMGLVSKENFASALRGHQAAVDATKSPQRDEAEASAKARSGNGKFA